MKRRNFIELSALASTALMVPEFLRSANMPSLLNMAAANGKKLVVIQLSGGNDGLNTVVPYRNDIYYKARPTISIARDAALPLTDEVGLHPKLLALKEFYEQGWLGILNNVGYPNPSRSHFRSTDIWQTGSDAHQYLNTGWIGRYLDAQCHDPACNTSIMAIEKDDTLSLALRGEKGKGLAVGNAEVFYKLARQVQHQGQQPMDNDNLVFLYKTMAETEVNARYVYEQSRIFRTQTQYPAHPLGQDLRDIAELIVSGISTTVFYASLSGFDSHVGQLNMQSTRLNEVSEALLPFVSDLKAHGRLNDTLIVIFSEFGRRVKQNASNGTDHGTANNVFLISSSLKQKGILNEQHDLSKLEEGDLIHKIDFRSVYATVLKKWLGANDEQILGRKFQQLGFI